QSTYTALASHNSADGTRCTVCHDHGKDFGAECSNCHGGGTNGTFSKNYWPDDYTAVPENDAGKHLNHMDAIAVAMGYLSAADLLEQPTANTLQTNACAYCHPGGGHSGGEVAPAELGSFKDILGNSDALGAYTQSGGNVDCTVLCHYNNAMPDTDWYAVSPSVDCSYCHTDGVVAYTTDDLPNAHNVHVDETSDGGYNLACLTCHDTSGYTVSHENGVIELSTANLPQEADADAVLNIADTSVKMGAAGTYTTCQNVYCHGDFTYGGNDANIPDWGDAATGDCGTCHGDSAAAGGETEKASPITGSYASAHTSHVTSNIPGISCSACHYDAAGTNGTYGNNLKHADTVLDKPGLDTAYNYEAGTVSYDDINFQCSNVMCHNGKLTPVFTASISCGDCHGSGSGDAVPTGSTERSHPAHTNNDSDYTECTYCHGAAVSSYTANGGDSAHQNLSVELPLGGGNYIDGDGGAGIDYSGDFTDNGTCDTTLCHGGGTPVWGGTITVACLSCHNGTEAAFRPEGPMDGLPNGVSQAQYQLTGHGVTGNHLSGNAGAGFTDSTDWSDGVGCNNCHQFDAAHLPKDSANDPFRLGSFANDLDSFCLQGAGPGCHDTTIAKSHTHVNVGDSGSSITWPGPEYDFKCVDCHDPHGDSNLYMVKQFVPAPQSAADTSFGTNAYGILNDTGFLPAVTFSAVTGRGAGDYTISGGDGICEVCHTQTDYYDRGNLDPETHYATPTPTRCTTCHLHKEGFKPGACNSCHGFPPTSVDEDYSGGGGAHQVHVQFIADATGVAYPAGTVFNTEVFCEPCHGTGAGKPETGTHNISGGGTDPWTAANRAQINIVARTGADSWGVGVARYNGTLISTDYTVSAYAPNSTPVTAADSGCEQVSCHGMDGTESATMLNWASYTDTATETDALARSKVCENCHDETPAVISLANDVLTNVYDSSTDANKEINAAANYYGTLSGYARGGHGDSRISDPAYEPALATIDPSTGNDAPIDCTACHDSTSQHYGSDHDATSTGNPNRLQGLTRASSSADVNALCANATCHPTAFYSGPSNGTDTEYHHPMLSNGDLGALAAPKVLTAVDGGTNWTEIAPVELPYHYEQNAYGAANYDTHVDSLKDWWAGDPATSRSSDVPPTPVLYGENQSATPKAILPLARYVIGGGISNDIVCTTCHNPHGSDLYVYDPGGIGQDIPDNNMLRLRDTDSTLCNACH
ncbi:MAG: hypothetical protein C0608_09400, partial [Deltaproteobacteria bacterium]